MPAFSIHSSLTLSTILVIELLIVVKNIPSCFCDSYSNCTTRYVCGNLNATYPYWGNQRPSGCGLPQFELHCRNNVITSIKLNNVTYRVLQITADTQILRIVRQDFEDGICPPEFVNTTLDPQFFEVANGYENVTFVYGCLYRIASASKSFNCSVSGATYRAGYVLPGAFGPGTCYKSVYVPVSASVAPAGLINKAGLENDLAQDLAQGFEVRWTTDNSDCNDCVDNGGACGYNLNSTQFTCYCPTGSTTCSSSSDSGSNSSGFSLKWKLVAGIGGIVTFSSVLACWFAWKYSRNGTKYDHQKVEAFMKKYGSIIVKRYSYWEVKNMTNSFKVKLGQGGYGSVYKGTLSDGRLVAVKILSESTGDGEEFINEVASISRTAHVNIVALVGFCYGKTKRALIYEFLSKGSLDKFIYDDNEPTRSNPGLDWETLHQISLGIARGLQYLHQGCSTRILHLDIKPQNILLDEDLCPKISDFGLAKLCEMKRSEVSLVAPRGTIGYMAPEIYSRNLGAVSHKSDVYSYGMLIVEMMGGRQNVKNVVSNTSEMYFPDWIYKLVEGGRDLRVLGPMSSEEEGIIRKLILVSLWCIQTMPSDRPSMKKVVEMLEGSVESLQAPPKPCLSTAAYPVLQLPSTSSTISP